MCTGFGEPGCTHTAAVVIYWYLDHHIEGCWSLPWTHSTTHPVISLTWEDLLVYGLRQWTHAPKIKSETEWILCFNVFVCLSLPSLITSPQQILNARLPLCLKCYEVIVLKLFYIHVQNILNLQLVVPTLSSRLQWKLKSCLFKLLHQSVNKYGMLWLA
jgi:hypothetical protein